MGLREREGARLSETGGGGMPRLLGVVGPTVEDAGMCGGGRLSPSHLPTERSASGPDAALQADQCPLQGGVL